uniref:S1C family serine protease n=1 Tax=Streptomyces phaeolivaceus TaxID=2653200 RepID=UPI00384DB1A0
MNEGKPTKAKWWSRPRAHGAGDGTAGEHLGAAEADGPTGPPGAAGLPPSAVRGENPDGDFELERPTPATGEAATRTEIYTDAGAGSDAGSESDSDSDSDSDFELARPVAEAPLRSGPTPSAAADADAAVGLDGDFELERPAGPNGSSADTAVVDARPVGAQGALSAPGAPSERPKPLHDPDPYGTPPYGEPGPWAPAPPVQHPATTPAHGTHVRAATPAHGTHVRAATPAHGADAQAGTPAHGVPVTVGAPTDEGAHALGPTAAGGSVAAGSAGGGAPSAAASAVAPTSAGAPSAAAAAHAGTPAQGTAVPPTTPQPAAVAQHPEVPGPGVAAYSETARPAAPYPHAPQPPGASYAYPSQPGPPPFGDSAQAVAPPYAGGTHPVPPPFGDSAHPVPPPYAGGGQPARGVPGVAQGPWQNYDPWAGSGSLQQNGARPRRRSGRVLLVGALLIAVVAGGIGGAVGAYLERNGGVGAIELPQTSDGVTDRAPDSVAGIAASALPSVVTLHVSGDSAQGTGTGFVLDERGHILTNNHVVDPAGTNGDISVTFSGGETAEATIVGRDTGYDLAVVKVSGVGGLKPLPLGNSEEVQVGDPVVAIGAPFDLANTVTSGIISAKERPITAGGESGDVSDVSYVDALQTDAPINPGNSGGPLLDGKARVIGINSAIRSAGSGSESDGGQAGSIGLGFAIPINQGKRVAEELINTGKATHPVIGVTLDMDYAGDGARIGDEGDGDGTGVASGGPADRAGIRSGDVITEVDGQRVHSGDELIVKVRAHRPGDRLELTLLRDGRERTVTLTLGSSGGA